MSDSSIGVAVIGAGMAGRAHINGYRAASTVFGSGLPEIRLVAVADAHEPFAADAAQRYGYQRAETGWEAIAAAPDIDAVSVVVANHLHRPIVEALLARGSTGCARSRWRRRSPTPRRWRRRPGSRTGWLRSGSRSAGRRPSTPSASRSPAAAWAR